MSRLLAPLTVALLLSATLSACSIRTHDEIECGLPDGSSFILRNSYDWYPLAKFVPHASERLNSTGFSTYYRPRNSGREIHAAGAHSASLILPKYNDLDYIARLCALHGMINGVPYVLANRYIPPGADGARKLNARDELFRAVIFGREVDQPQFEDIKDLELRFDRNTVSWAVDTIIWRPDLLAIETPLVAKNAPDPAPVVGAYRIESRDGGQSWKNPHLTLKPEVYKLGKPAAEQCFVARLIRIDGRRFKPDFPDCPVAFALPERRQ
ncbi:hypothetical protein IAI53_02140 [Thauera sp. CAU 1555]|uniref:Lipoprotein n=1 Tax=Thauera sedimentorum TaxID=2767595 RepID=A0ABR9B5Y6_9RHOO|nr:hypothetical protein [Thauera sedimentorum]MBC9070753.1 hypothetical protein [Thauera sedimentorum]MBD8501672.1 hypothetical protein [Thauera sedimentorum]